MSHQLLYLPELIHYFGFSWLIFRLSYAARQKLGFIRRRMPARQWAACPLSQYLQDPILAEPSAYCNYRLDSAPSFFFAPSDVKSSQSHFSQWDTAATNTPISRADDINKAVFRYFEHHSVKTTFPPDWHMNSFTGYKSPSNKHWSEISDFANGDIKLIWELSRFTFVYALVRAYWRTGDEKYAEMFWLLVEDWRAKNPPNFGANWKCGQEITFRVMAWCFGFYGFLKANATNAERILVLAQMIAVSGERIEGNIDYALSQRNNHGISEAVGLWTVGLLFPELKKAAHWRDKGKKLLEEQGKSLIYDDGSFSQHSVNYHRLMLHDYLWAMRLGDLNGQPLSNDLKVRVKRAGEFLYQMQDDVTGQVPYYGQNDGALILPLNNCDYLDFWPVVQAIHYYFSGEKLFASGPWDEDVLWLFGQAALSAPVTKVKTKQDLSAKEGGYYTLRTEKGFAFTRCATFRDRPGQSDMLHVDLWWRGQNVAMDAGTYSYNAPESWDNPLAKTAYHNTVTVDDQDQMERVNKFLWLPWLKGKVSCMKRSSHGHLAYWEGSHDGYRRLPSPVDHRRGILQLGEESWMILDQLIGTAPHRYRLHWLLPDLEHSWHKNENLLVMKTGAGSYHVQTRAQSQKGICSLVRCDEKSPRGWCAPYYFFKKPALSLDMSVDASQVFFCTLFSPDFASIEWLEDHMSVKASSWQAEVSMQAATNSMISKVSLTGTETDFLELT